MESYIKQELIVLNHSNQDLTFSVGTVNLKKEELIKYWDRDFINSTLSKIENHNHKMLFKFLWMSGVRITEAVSLRKRDIDFDNFLMEVRWLKSRKYQKRILPIHPLLRDLLQLYSANFKADDRIFSMSRQRAWQLSKKYFGDKPHRFRHSFAVNWLLCDGDMIILHKILGHSKIQTTMEYLKIVPSDQGKELIKIQF